MKPLLHLSILAIVTNMNLPSGSYVMGFVLADAKSWSGKPGQAPFEVIPLQTFANLRNGVNDGLADFFMWESFTSKRYYKSKSIKNIGEIYTPWSSWKIVARNGVGDPSLDDLFLKIDQGIKYFEQHQDEAVKYISTELDYEEEDAREWLDTVRFANGVQGVSMETVEKTIKVLQKAGVLEEGVDPALVVERAREI